MAGSAVHAGISTTFELLLPELSSTSSISGFRLEERGSHNNILISPRDDGWDDALDIDVLDSMTIDGAYIANIRLHPMHQHHDHFVISRTSPQPHIIIIEYLISKSKNAPLSKQSQTIPIGIHRRAPWL